MSDMVPVFCWKTYIDDCERLGDASFRSNVVRIQFLEELQRCGD